MPTKPVKMFTAWSFSRWKDHSSPTDGCPYRARLKHLDKVAEGPKGPALIRGEQIHKLAEEYVKGTIEVIPTELALFKKEFATLRKKKATPEGKWAVDAAWGPVDFFDWEHAWLRVVLDAHFKPTKATALVIDYKTGKIYGDNKDQMELYAIAGFAHYPEVDVVNTELWYLDQGEIKKETFSRGNVKTLKKKWLQKIIPLMTDRKFIPRPGDYCSRCAYSARKNGPCKY